MAIIRITYLTFNWRHAIEHEIGNQIGGEYTIKAVQSQSRNNFRRINFYSWFVHLARLITDGVAFTGFATIKDKGHTKIRMTNVRNTVWHLAHTYNFYTDLVGVYYNFGHNVCNSGRYSRNHNTANSAGQATLIVV